MKGFVYLIGSWSDDDYYKIGVTTKKCIDGRVKELQTGNANELYVKDYFETDYPFKLEAMLHNRYRNKQVLNEWFYMTPDEVRGFKDECIQCQVIIESLQGNDIFFKRKPHVNQDETK